LVAPEPFGEQPRPYELKLPPGSWFDYWSGARVPDGKGLSIQPQLDTLPVFVREGTILPMEPLTQSTEETPQGALTLRVYPGKNCKGSVYLDDGKTLAYQHGDSLRVEFSCAVNSDGIAVHLGEHQGKFRAWWNQIHLEIYGWDSAGAQFRTKGAETHPRNSVDSSRHVLTVDVADDQQGQDFEIRRSK
jgi:alpha-glucosidase